MRVLLDEQLPRRRAHHLTGHDLSTVQERGWASVQNGELLALAAAGFEVILTADRNLEYQQNLESVLPHVLVLVVRRIALLLYHAPLCQE